PSLETLIWDFLLWEPTPITRVSTLVETLGPLARMLREEIVLALKEERRLRKANPDISRTHTPFLGSLSDWRAMLFPNATNAEFADGFAQTVVFALVTALSENIDLKDRSLRSIAESIEISHSLLGRSLSVLTEY